MDRADLFGIAWDILKGYFEEDPCTEIVDEVVSCIDDTDIDEDQAIELIKEICRNMGYMVE